MTRLGRCVCRQPSDASGGGWRRHHLTSDASDPVRAPCRDAHPARPPSAPRRPLSAWPRSGLACSAGAGPQSASTLIMNNGPSTAEPSARGLPNTTSHPTGPIRGPNVPWAPPCRSAPQRERREPLPARRSPVIRHCSRRPHRHPTAGSHSHGKPSPGFSDASRPVDVRIAHHWLGGHGREQGRASGNSALSWPSLSCASCLSIASATPVYSILLVSIISTTFVAVISGLHMTKVAS